MFPTLRILFGNRIPHMMRQTLAQRLLPLVRHQLHQTVGG